MKSIINFSLNNKFAVWLLTIMVVVAGMYAGLTMKQETIPDIDIPILAVTTVYPGAASEEIAEEVSIPLELAVRNLNGVTGYSTTSMENASSLIIEYAYDKDMKEAENEMKEALELVSLPQGTMDSSISRISIDDFPIISLSITGEGKSLEEITKIVEMEFKSRLEAIDGVAAVAVSGQQVREVTLDFDHVKMDEMGLSEEMVRGIIQGSVLQIPLGLFELDQEEKSIVVDGNITTIDELNNVIIPVMGEDMSMNMVRLQDIASIELIEKAESISRTNGQLSLGVNITKAPDANTVEIVNAVKEQNELMMADYPGVDIIVMLDQGEPIEESVSTMLNKALFGALFAFIIILLFLRNVRTTIISIISIPLSLVLTLLILKQLDITLNIMTLGAMTVAIGRVVDDSIVVIENNFRRMQLKEEKLSGKELVLSATHEMSKPILSSTLVTVAVFIPLATVTGPVGELFTPFALAMTIALLGSLLVAITVVPVLTHQMFKRGVKKREHEKKPGALANRYRNILRWTLDHKIITSSIAVILFVGSLGLVYFGLVGTSFLPEEEQNFVMITYSPGPGELLSDVEEAALTAESIILDREGMTDLQYSVGGENPLSPGASRSALFYAMYADEIEDFAAEKESLLAELEGIDSTGRWGLLDIAAGFGGNTLSLYVYGPDITAIEPVVDEIAAFLEADDAFDKVDTSLSETYAEYRLIADQEKLSQFGLTAGQIAMYLSPQRGQTLLTHVSVDGTSYPVYVNEDQQTQEFNSIDDITNAMIPSPFGFAIPLNSVVTVEEGESAGTITRRNGEMYVEVTADIVISDIGAATTAANNKIDEISMPPFVHVETGGVAEQLEETFTQLGLAMVAAVAIIYFMLVITFGGAATPFVILFSLPFITIGSFSGLYIANETISAPVMMGLLMLIGIVVTNAIVLIDRVINKEKEGLNVREALLEAAGTRLRPILMTALATIGALLPLALGFEGSNESLISKGLGVVVIGGLLSSTLLTLIIVPLVYELFANIKGAFARLFNRKSVAK